MLKITFPLAVPAFLSAFLLNFLRALRSFETPVLQGAHVWSTDANARGGINGHRVRVIFGDDAGEPVRALALARRMVDQDKVIGFYAERGPTTMQAVMPYLEQQHIPLIGGCNCGPAPAHSPMAFEVGPGGDHGIAANDGRNRSE